VPNYLVICFLDEISPAAGQDTIYLNNEAHKSNEGSRNSKMYKALLSVLPALAVEAISLATILQIIILFNYLQFDIELTKSSLIPS
jgi:hypothetical protein